MLKAASSHFSKLREGVIVITERKKTWLVINKQLGGRVGGKRLSNVQRLHLREL